MAKIRVYELAKDLNMTNKALRNKMKELKIEVKSHMSSLKDSEIGKIKRDLLGKVKKRSDVKGKSSVIRRRKPSNQDFVEETIEPENEQDTILLETEEPESWDLKIKIATNKIFQKEYEEAFNTPYIAAERGYIDAVIQPSETRIRLINALEIMITKKEALPMKKHGNIPV